MKVAIQNSLPILQDWILVLESQEHADERP